MVNTSTLKKLYQDKEALNRRKQSILGELENINLELKKNLKMINIAEGKTDKRYSLKKEPKRLTRDDGISS